MSNFEYTVAIRTVGKAGDKYKKELESLHAQTVKPKRILIFLAEGFERPNFQVGYEEYIIVPKGLVHQRAASTQGVDTEFLLILDDDVYFPEGSVEKMHEELMKHHADCISPDTFPNQELSLSSRLIAFFANGVSSRGDDKWAIKIKRNGAFSFNAQPPKGQSLQTESAAGPALFIKTDVFKAIHYEDEFWVDQFPAGTFYEDQLMFNKIHKNGFKVLLQYDAGIIHLDAGTNNVKQKTYEKLMYRAMANYVIWYRSCYNLTGISKGEQFKCSTAYGWRFFLGLLTRLAFSIIHLSPKFSTAFIKGHRKGKSFVKSEEYKKIPNFIIK